MDNSHLKEILSEKGSNITCPFAVFIKDNKVLNGFRHYKLDNGKTLSVWTCPGGRCEAGETVEETLRREVYEETGIKDFVIIRYIGRIEGAKKGDIGLIFLCESSQSPKLMEPEKFSEWKWVLIKDYIAGESYSGFNPLARKMITDYLLKINQ